MDLNRAQLIGNVTRDPELRTTTGGQNVCSFGIATNSQWTDTQGQKQTRAEFHNIVAWGKLADICSQYLIKGKKIFLEGRLQTRDWEGQDGVKHRTTEIIADNMIMLDRGPMAPAVAVVPSAATAEAKPIANAVPAVVPLPNAPSAATLDRSIGDQEIRIEDIPF